jgi:dihydrofolate synthase/folylpolyglutamate synthase
VDAAHNGQAADHLASWLEQRPWLLTGRVRAVFSCFADKNAAAMLQPLLPIVTEWHLFELDSPRAASIDSLVNTLGSCHDPSQSVMANPVCHRHTSGLAALSAAMDGMGVDDCVLAFGSFMVVESILSGWQSRSQGI